MFSTVLEGLDKNYGGFFCRLWAPCLCFCAMNHRFGAQFRAPRRKRAYLDANVVVVFLGFVNKHGEQGQDGVRAEEGALGPDDCCREETQQNCQQPVETLPEHTLPVPL